MEQVISVKMVERRGRKGRKIREGRKYKHACGRAGELSRIGNILVVERKEVEAGVEEGATRAAFPIGTRRQTS